MKFKRITVSYHAVMRWCDRFSQQLEPQEARACLEQMIATGSAIGAQLRGGLAIEFINADGTAAYAVGRLCGQHYIVATILTRDQFIGSITGVGIRAPEKIPKARKTNRRSRRVATQRVADKKPWRCDHHVEPPVERPRRRPPEPRQRFDEFEGCDP